MSKSILSGNEEGLTINKGKLGSLNIYEVTEDELEKLETGGSDPIYLNFAIFTLSIALSFFITLVTTTIESNRIFITFLIITIIGFLSGIILLIIWWRSKRSIKDLVKKIKDRLQQKVDVS
ncbi:MAG: hypothetical protein KJ597_01020 [Nanoarchaeota archaeon]|nr:hypothetical protein [Nanoarchaeota archaeon]MBU1622133.1 hypothetical protein [Nanoarchaeota archaeon]